MKKYKYSGDIISRFSIDEKEFCLVPGEVVEMPSDHAYTMSLIASGKLSEITPASNPVVQEKKKLKNEEK